MIIYKPINLINGKIYIGQSVYNNPNYLGSGKYIKRAIKKYTKDNFIKEILEILPIESTQDDLNECESKWIALYNSTNPTIGYNLMKSSGQNGKHGEETKKIMSEKLKGNKRFLNHKHTEETCKKMGLSKLDNKYRLGKKHNIDSITKNRESQPTIKRICKLDLNNNFIQDYPSLNVAGKENNICYIYISNCCKGKQKTSGGFKWKYKD